MGSVGLEGEEDLRMDSREWVLIGKGYWGQWRWDSCSDMEVLRKIFLVMNPAKQGGDDPGWEICWKEGSYHSVL